MGKQSATLANAAVTFVTETCAATSPTTVAIGSRKLQKLNWTRINYRGTDHDNRRLVEHREKDCECEVCYRELHQLPPVEPLREKLAARKLKLDEREVKRAKKKARLDVKAGKQACIRNFFRY